MNSSPTVRKKAASATSSKSFVISLIAKEAAVMRMHAEALQQAVSDVERAASGGKGPHPPGPGPIGEPFSGGKGPHGPGPNRAQFAGGKGPHVPGPAGAQFAVGKRTSVPSPTAAQFAGGKGPHPPGPGPTGDQFAALYRSLGAVLQAAGALQQPIADLMRTAEG